MQKLGLINRSNLVKPTIKLFFHFTQMVVIVFIGFRESSISLLVQPFDSAQGTAMPSPRRN